MKYRVLDSVLRGLTASLYVILLLVTIARDYEKMAFLRIYSIWIFSAIVLVAIVSKSTGMRVRPGIVPALVGLILIWAAAFVLAPL
jgi:hypothetical protein